MGHNKKKTRMKHGSRQFWPRVRAKRIYPRVRHETNGKPVLQGFAGYKAGMTSIFVVDNRPKSPTKGEEIKFAVTVLETPPVKVFGVRLYGVGNYSTGAYGDNVLDEVWADNLDEKVLGRRLRLPKKNKHKIDELKQKLADATEIRVLVHMQPSLAGISKKIPEVFELPIGGDVTAAFDYASSILGKEISASDVFKAGEILDIHSVTKGTGFTGVVKRYGVKLLHHKSEFSRRKIGSLGTEGMGRVGWWSLQCGQGGYHVRTEHNKQLMKLGDVKKDKITPVSGFIKYGQVRSDYVLIAGSVAGPKKRLVRLSHASRPRKNMVEVAPEIVFTSLRSQQG